MLPAFGLYTHIRANRIRSLVLLAGLVSLVFVMTFAAALIGEALTEDRPLDLLLAAATRDLLAAAPWVALGTAVWVFLAYHFHQRLIDAVTGARRVTRTDQPRLYGLLETLCISRGLPTPRLEILPSDALNAFATGLNPRQYAITVTTALDEALTDAEMEAVLAHELTHIRNEDVRLMVVAVVIAGIVSFFGELIFRLITNAPWNFGGGRRGRSGSQSDSSDGSGRKGGGGGALIAILIGIALILVGWLLSQLIRFSLSRSREFLADAGAVELTKNPDAMIGALLKIAGKGELRGVPSGVMEMCIDNPRSGLMDLFATHPSIDARIAALVRYGGGHRPEPVPEAPAPRDGPWGRATGA